MPTMRHGGWAAGSLDTATLCALIVFFVLMYSIQHLCALSCLFLSNHFQAACHIIRLDSWPALFWTLRSLQSLSVYNVTRHYIPFSISCSYFIQSLMGRVGLRT